MEGRLILFEALFKKISLPGTRNPTVGREIDDTLSCTKGLTNMKWKKAK
jgi:hypothetical protein